MKNSQTFVYLGAVLCLAISPVRAESISMKPEVEALDLETGTVSESMAGPILEAGADIHISWHADRVPHAVVATAGEGVSIGYLSNAYSNVTTADIASISFSSQIKDRAFDNQATVLVRTTDGSVFKLGNPVETDDAVSFEYARLQ